MRKETERMIERLEDLSRKLPGGLLRIWNEKALDVCVDAADMLEALDRELGPPVKDVAP